MSAIVRRRYQDGGGVAPYGLREDGTPKGKGYFGMLKRPDGQVSSELSASSNVGGQEIFYPLIVPTLDAAELKHLLSGEKPTEAIYEKAISHAQERVKAGLSPFAAPTEMHRPLPDGYAEGGEVASLDDLLKMRDPNANTGAIKRTRGPIISDEVHAQTVLDETRPDNLEEFQQAIERERDPKKKKILQDAYDHNIGELHRLSGEAPKNPVKTGAQLLGLEKPEPPAARAEPGQVGTDYSAGRRNSAADAGAKLMGLDTYGAKPEEARTLEEQLADTEAQSPARITLGPRGGGARLEATPFPPGEDSGAPYTGEVGRAVLPATLTSLAIGLKNTMANLGRLVAEGRKQSIEGEQAGATPPLLTPGAQSARRFFGATGPGPKGAPPDEARQKQLDAELERVTAYGQKMKDWARDLQVESKLTTPENMSTFQEALVSAVGSSPPTAVGMSLGILTKSPALSMAVMGSGGFLQQGADAYGECMDKIGDHEKCAWSAMRQGTVEAADALPLGIALKVGSPTRSAILNFFQRMLVTSAGEGATEMAQQALQDLDAYATYNPDMTFGEAWHNIKVAGAAGVMMGLGVGAGGELMHSRREARQAVADAIARQYPRANAQAITAGLDLPGSAPQGAPAGQPAPFTPTHRLEDGTPVVAHQEEGAPVAGVWRDEAGSMLEAPRAEPVAAGQNNAVWLAGGTPYDVQVVGQGSGGTALLADGQHVPIDQLRLEPAAELALLSRRSLEVLADTEQPTLPLSKFPEADRAGLERAGLVKTQTVPAPEPKTEGAPKAEPTVEEVVNTLPLRDELRRREASAAPKPAKAQPKPAQEPAPATPAAAPKPAPPQTGGETEPPPPRGSAAPVSPAPAAAPAPSKAAKLADEQRVGDLADENAAYLKKPEVVARAPGGNGDVGILYNDEGKIVGHSGMVAQGFYRGAAHPAQVRFSEGRPVSVFRSRFQFGGPPEAFQRLQESIKVARAPSSKQLAQRKRMSKEGLARRRIDYEKDSLLPALVKRGGINKSLQKEITGDTKANVSVPFVGWLFSPNGQLRELDAVVEVMQEEGFISQADVDSATDTGGTRLADEMINDELRGNKHWSAFKQNLEEPQDEQPPEEALADEAEQLEGYPLSQEIAPEDLSSRDVEPTAANLAIADLMAKLPEEVAERVAMKNANATDDEMLAALRRAMEDLDEAGNSQEAAQRGAQRKASSGGASEPAARYTVTRAAKDVRGEGEGKRPARAVRQSGRPQVKEEEADYSAAKFAKKGWDFKTTFPEVHPESTYAENETPEQVASLHDATGRWFTYELARAERLSHVLSSGKTEHGAKLIESRRKEAIAAQSAALRMGDRIVSEYEMAFGHEAAKAFFDPLRPKAVELGRSASEIVRPQGEMFEEMPEEPAQDLAGAKPRSSAKSKKSAVQEGIERQKAKEAFEKREAEYRKEFKVGDTVQISAAIVDLAEPHEKDYGTHDTAYVSGAFGKIEKITPENFFVRTHLYGQKSPSVLTKLDSREFHEVTDARYAHAEGFTFEQWRDEMIALENERAGGSKEERLALWKKSPEQYVEKRIPWLLSNFEKMTLPKVKDNLGHPEREGEHIDPDLVERVVKKLLLAGTIVRKGQSLQLPVPEKREAKKTETQAEPAALPKGVGPEEKHAAVRDRNEAILSPPEGTAPPAEAKPVPSQQAGLFSPAEAPVGRPALKPRKPGEGGPQGSLFEPTPVDYAAAAARGHLASEAQQEAGNYEKGHILLGPEGKKIDISFENEAGTQRNPDWPALTAHYGYLKNTIGYDKDHLDAFVKPGTPESWAGTVFVVNQGTEGVTDESRSTGVDGPEDFDEHKVMIGYESEGDAEQGYLSNYEQGWQHLISVVPMSWDAFHGWAHSDSDRLGPKAGELLRNQVRHWEDKAIVEKGGPAAPPQPIKVSATATAFEGLVVEVEKQRNVKLPTGRIRNEYDAATMFSQFLGTAPREHFHMIGVDAKGRPIAYYPLFSGTITQTSVYPREVWTVLYGTPGVKGVWFAHNHPSGTPVPSQADELLTRNLRELLVPKGVEYKGHLIIAGEMARELEGQAFKIERPAPGSRNVPVMERVIKHQAPPMAALTSPGAAREFIRSLNPPGMGLVIMDAQHRALGWWDMPLEKIAAMTRDTAGRYTVEVADLIRMVGRNNPAAALLYAPEGVNREVLQREATKLKEILGLAEVKLLDAFAKEPGGALTSLAERGLMETFRYQQPTRRGNYSLDLGGKRQGFPAATVHDELAKLPLAAAMGERVRVVQQARDLPAHAVEELIELGAMKIVRGYTDASTGRVYLVADNLKPGEAEKTFLHESVGHAGIADVLGEHYMREMQDIFRSRRADIAREAKDGFLKPYALDLSRPLDQVQAASEWIAHRAERGEEQALWQRVVALIRSILREMGLVHSYSDSDILNLLQMSRASLMNDGSTYNGRPSFQLGEPGPIWYSALERQVEVKGPGRALPKAWEGLIKNLQGVTKAEIEATGVLDWLAAREDYEGTAGKPVPKEAVLEYLRLNGVVLAERQLGGVREAPRSAARAVVMDDARNAHHDALDALASEYQAWAVEHKVLGLGDAEDVRRADQAGIVDRDETGRAAGVIAHLTRQEREYLDSFLNRWNIEQNGEGQVAVDRIGADGPTHNELRAMVAERDRLIVELDAMGLEPDWNLETADGLLNHYPAGALLGVHEPSIHAQGAPTYIAAPGVDQAHIRAWGAAHGEEDGDFEYLPFVGATTRIQRVVARLADIAPYTAQWTGGEVIQADSNIPDIPDDGAAAFNRDAAFKPARHTHWTLPGGQNQVELIISVPKATPWPGEDDTHYGDLTGRRGVAWFRANERTDPQGRKGLFVEEIQSKRGEVGRDLGFEALPDSTGRANLAVQHQKLSDEARALWPAAKEAFYRNDLLGFDYLPDAAAAVRLHLDWENRWSVPASADAVAIEAWATTSRQLHEVGERLHRRTGVPTAPFVTNTEQWASLALKRAIRYAVDHGYQWVAWTTGDQQNKRYSLATYYRALRVVRNTNIHPRADANRYTLEAEMPGHTHPDILATSYSNETLAEAIGAELAKKALESTEMKEKGEVTIKGDDLISVGGQGMRQFYDSMLPKIANRVLKALGGGKVQVYDLSGGDRYYVQASSESTLAVIDRDTGRTAAVFMRSGQSRSLHAGAIPPHHEVAAFNAAGRRSADDTPEMQAQRYADEANAAAPQRVGKQLGFEVTDGLRNTAARGMPMFSLRNDPRGVKEVYGVRDGRLLGLATKAGAGWNVFVASGTNEGLFERGQYSRYRARSLNEVNAIFARAGLETRIIRPQNIPIPQTTMFDRNWQAPRVSSKPSDTIRQRTRSWLDNAVINLQNRLLLPEKMEQVIEREVGQIPEEAKAHREARLAHPRAAGMIADFEHDYVDPIVDLAKKWRLSLKDIGAYRYALHAPERNAHVESINPENKAGSGIYSTRAEAVADGKPEMQDAETMLAGIRSRLSAEQLTALEQVSTLIDRINYFREERLIDKGLAKREFVELLRDRYKHYAPLKEIAEDDELQGGEIGSGFKVRKPLRLTLGRFTEADAEFILPALIAQAKGTIAGGENAEVLRTLMKQVQYAPNPEVWDVRQSDWRPFLDRGTGMVMWAPRRPDSRKTINVPVNGDWYTIHVNDPALAKAFNTSGVTLPESMQWIGAITRFYATMATAANPEFVITNLLRDMQEAMIRVGGINGPALAAKAAKDIPAAFWGAFRGLREHGQVSAEAGEWQRWYRRYIEAGGQIAYRGIQDADQQHQDFMAKMAAAGIYPESGLVDGLKARITRAKTLTGAQFVFDLVRDINGAVENATRLSIFKNAIEAGIDEKEAAMIARNATVDFNLSGEQRWLNQVFMFFNANVQGSALLFRTILQSRGARVAAGGLLALGLFFQWWNRKWADEDEAGQNYYDKISEDLKQRNIVIMGPDRKNAIMIPLPFGFGIFHNMGRHLMALMPKDKGGAGEGVVDAGLKTFTAAINAFSPFGNVPTSWLGMVQTVSPTVTDPMVQHWTNRNWMDKPIHPERPRFAEVNQPQSHASTYHLGTTQSYVDVAQWLNEHTGGNEVRSGWIDIYPNVLEHYVNSVFGSSGATYARLFNFLGAKAQGKDVETKDIPILRRFYYEPQDFELSRRFYENVNRAEVAHREVMVRMQAGDPAGAALLREEFKGERQMHGEALAAEASVAQLRAEERRVRKHPGWTADQKKLAIERLDTQARRVMQGFNNRFDQRTGDQ